VNWRLELSKEDKAAFAFLSAYERVRKERQRGYQNFKEDTPEILTTSKFKTARTLSKWFGLAWQVTRKQPNLEGYIAYCFRRNAPTVPMLGQLRNNHLLGEFIAASPDGVQIKELKPHELTAIYRKTFDPLLANTQTLAALGLIPRTK